LKIEGRGVQSIEVGGRILSAMVELGRPAMLRDIAALANLASAQAHAYLVSYRQMGMVEQDALSGRYLLGPFALQLGLARMRCSDPLRMASNAADQLAERTGLMVTVSVWGTHGPTIIQVQESARPIHVNLRYTLTGTATGRLFTAFYSNELVRPLLNEELRASRKDGRAMPTKEQETLIESDVQEIRLRGYATTVGRPVPGINAASVPVYDHTGKMQFALTVVGPDFIFDVQPDSVELPAIIEFVEALSAQLGYRKQRIETQDAEDLSSKPVPAARARKGISQPA